MDEPRPGLQDRLEGSDVGRVLISALIVVAVVVVVTANLPGGYLKRELTRVADPAIDATGLVQVWGVFAPDPRRTAVDLEATIRFADGSTETWHDPTGPPFVGEYRLFRWRKLMEWAIADEYRDTLWRPVSLWLARNAARDGRQPVEVDLVRRWRDLYPPGSTPSQSPWRRAVYYRLEVTPELLAGKAA